MKSIWMTTGTLLLLLTLGVVFSVPAVAADKPAGVIAYRQRVMKAMSGHLGGIGMIAKHGLSYKGDIADHAAALIDLAKMVPDLFPEGTGEGKTDALPKIWSDAGGFKKAREKLQQETVKLARVAGGGGNLGAQVKAVGKSCGGCHKHYRQPKEKRYAWKKK